jgi:hypothetical protein
VVDDNQANEAALSPDEVITAFPFPSTKSRYFTKVTFPGKDAKLLKVKVTNRSPASATVTAESEIDVTEILGVFNTPSNPSLASTLNGAALLGLALFSRFQVPPLD